MSNTSLIITVAPLWLIVAAIHHGLSFAYAQRKWKIIAEESYWSDLRYCLVMSLMFSPFALASHFIVCRGESLKFGFKLW